MSTKGKGARFYVLYLPKQYTELEGMCCIDIILSSSEYNTSEQ